MPGNSAVPIRRSSTTKSSGIKRRNCLTTRNNYYEQSFDKVRLGLAASTAFGRHVQLETTSKCFPAKRPENCSQRSTHCVSNFEKQKVSAITRWPTSLHKR